VYVLEMPPFPTVVFDLDGTLLDGDSTTAWMISRIRRSWARIAIAIAAAPLAGLLMTHSRSRRWGASIALWIASAGQTEDELRASFGVFADGVHRGEGPIGWREAGLLTMRGHIERDEPVIIATAAPAWLAERLIEGLNLSTIAVVGSTLGPWLGGWIGIRHCCNQAKCDALWAAGHGQRWAVAYTDSADDLPLLARADRACLVNGSVSTLARFAKSGVAVETMSW
jgi:phosphatidylglycerophosphatase C